MLLAQADSVLLHHTAQQVGEHVHAPDKESFERWNLIEQSCMKPKMASCTGARSPLLASAVKMNVTLRVQVPNNHILTQNLYYNYNYSKPKYLIIGYLDPLGKGSKVQIPQQAGCILCGPLFLCVGAV